MQNVWGEERHRTTHPPENFPKSLLRLFFALTEVILFSEVILLGVGADGVGVKFPHFCSKLLLFALVL